MTTCSLAPSPPSPPPPASQPASQQHAQAYYPGPIRAAAGHVCMDWWHNQLHEIRQLAFSCHRNGVCPWCSRRGPKCWCCPANAPTPSTRFCLISTDFAAWVACTRLMRWCAASCQSRAVPVLLRCQYIAVHLQPAVAGRLVQRQQQQPQSAATATMATISSGRDQ